MANEAQADHADSELRELGFDPTAAPEQALETLRALSDRPGANQAAIARALGEIKLAGAADLLAAMEHRASGAVRREIRRSLFKLRRLGFEPAPAAAPEQSKSKPAAAAESEGISALLSPFDHTGARMVWIMKPRVQGGLSHLAGVTSESEGLVGAGVTERSRRELRQKRAEIEREIDFAMVEADWRLADLILCEAYRRTPATARREVGDFLARRAEITAEPPPGPDFVHPVYRELLPAEPVEPSVDLLRTRQIMEWKFPADEIKPYVAEITELQGSTLVLNPLQQQDRVEAVIDKALTGLFAGERGYRIRRRLEDIAYYMAHAKAPELARWAAAAAAAIRDGADLKRIAFFRGFIRVVLGATLAEQEERAKEEPRLIMTPAEAMRAQQARGRSR
jgi:hypothetical protein